MRTSGRGGLGDSMMFVAPAVLFGGFFLWVWGGDPRDIISWLDRTVIHATNVAWTWCATVVEAITKG